MGSIFDKVVECPIDGKERRGAPVNNRLLIQLEGRKLFHIVTLCLILLFLGGKITFSYFLSAPDESQKIYETLIQQVEGPLTEQNRQYIESEKARRDQIIAQDEQIRDDYISGKITQEEYEAHRAAYRKAIEEQSAFDQIYQRYLFLLEKEAQHSQLLEMAETTGDMYESRLADKQLQQFQNDFLLYYDIGWKKLIGDGNVDYLLLLFLMAVCIPYFLKEHETGMADLVDSSYKRNTLYRIKIVYILGLSFVSALVSQTVDTVCIMTRYDLPMRDAALQSLPAFGNCVYPLTLQQACIWSAVVRVISTVVLMLFICALCSWIKKTLPVVLLFILLVFFPAIGRNEMPQWLNPYLFPQILSGSRIFTQEGFVNLFGFPISGASIHLLFWIAVAVSSGIFIWMKMNNSTNK